MNSHVQQLQLATWQVGAKGLVVHLSNPLYYTWILEMYHIRGQNSHYKKLVWNERIKEGSKNAPKANLTPRWHANVIFEHVLKEGINIASLQGVFCCSIDLNFRLTESWGESKSDPMGEVACPSSSGGAIKTKNKKQKNKNAWARINKASGTMP